MTDNIYPPPLSRSEVLDKLSSLRRKYGDWTAHNIEILDGIYTISDQVFDRSLERAKVYYDFIKLFSNKKLEDCRVLDLGCLEGGISIRLAQWGAKLLGVDVRESHLMKARFASEILKLDDRIEWINSDINDSKFWDECGTFDIVVCSGLLYHLDHDDIPLLLARIFKSCLKDSILILILIFSNAQRVCQIDKWSALWGSFWQEHPKGLGLAQRLAKGWSSFKNDNAFWLTERSLTNLVISSGFSAFVKPLYPYHEWNHKNRDIWVALTNDTLSTQLPSKTEPDNRPILSTDQHDS